MSLAAYLLPLRDCWLALRDSIWPPDPHEQARAKLFNLGQELARRYERLIRRRKKIERLRGKLAREERRMARLTARVADCCQQDGKHAWRLALVLDRLRDRAEHTRQRLQHQELSYTRQRDQFDRKRRLLHRLQAKRLTGKG